MSIDLHQFFIDFQDHLAPRLDTYEQAIYLYVFRQSRLVGIDEVSIGFKSERRRLATGVGEGGKPMSEGTAYKKLDSLQQKGCLSIVRTNHTGRVLRLRLPSEIPGVIREAEPSVELDDEQLDFFEVAENRLRLLAREEFRCFYTLQTLDMNNFIVEHVISRPVGDNSYRNCVAASREANNKKGATSAEDFLRRLYREGYLNETEFQERNLALVQLKAGHLKPPSAQ